MNQKYHQKQDIRNSEKSLQGCAILFFVGFVILVIMGMMNFSSYSPYSVSQDNFLSQVIPWFVIFIIGGVVLATWTYMISSQKKDWLKLHGQTIQATVTDNRTETSLNHNNGHRSSTYHLYLEWHNPQTGVISKFATKSSSRSILRPRGSLVPIHIDPNDPKFYQVEV